MSKAKFTKGEWYAHPNGVGCGGIAIVNTPNGCVIPKSEDVANQDLIVAAPEMYEMLEQLSELMPFLDEQTHPNIECDALKYDIDKLLAKARGEK